MFCKNLNGKSQMTIRFKFGKMSALLSDETMLVSQKNFRAITGLALPNYRIAFPCLLYTFNFCVTTQRILLITEMFGGGLTQEIDMWFPKTIPHGQTEQLISVAVKKGLWGPCLEIKSRDPKRWKWLCSGNMTLRLFFENPERIEKVIVEAMNQGEAVI